MTVNLLCVQLIHFIIGVCIYRKKQSIYVRYYPQFQEWTGDLGMYSLQTRGTSILSFPFLFFFSITVYFQYFVLLSGIQYSS